MKIQQLHLSNSEWKTTFTGDGFSPKESQLVLAFGESSLLVDSSLFNNLKDKYPNASIICCSTAGEMSDDSVYDNSVVVTAVQMNNTRLSCIETNIKQHQDSQKTGYYLMEQLQAPDLKAVFILSDGTHINGSELVAGFNEKNKKHIPVTGGLAGDGARFVKTYVGLNKVPEEGNITAIGFYGDHIKVGHASVGGWDEFGPARTITKSQQNVLFEIDGKNALDLYKEYLGPYKDDLPGSALLFPLSLRDIATGETMVRTILSINEEEKSMTFAGNLPEGSKVRLMKANFDKLIDGSSNAAKNSMETFSTNPDLAILISCVGRKLILQERTEEEVQSAREIFGSRTQTTGFYSYGEISPFQPNSRCGLHNQTMTITTFTEN